MSSKLSFILLIICACLGFAASSPLQETNARRMAQGLPPLPPKFMRSVAKDLGAREGLTPSVVDTAKRSQTSPSPSVTLTGKLEIRGKDGHVNGHVRNWATPGTIGGINYLGPEDDLMVTLTYNPSQPSEINILATNPAFPGPFYVGAGGGSSTTGPVTLSKGSRNTLAFTNVDSTPPGAKPTLPPIGQSFVESAIWSIEKGTKKLQAQWINADDSKPPTILAYDIRANVLFFVGDIDAYNTNNDTPASAVEIFLV